MVYGTPAELIQSTDRAISWEYNSCKTHPLAVFQVRNLTYMVTRREKIKRSVCKVQEQIFNSYIKQLEQERVSGTLSVPFLMLDHRHKVCLQVVKDKQDLICSHFIPQKDEYPQNYCSGQITL